MADEADHPMDASGAWRRAKPNEPPIVFSDFILSLGMNAAAMLGQDGLGSEDQVASHADLIQAAQHIDILRMLREKTRGNLDDDDAKLLDSLIYDLQMRYLQVAREQGD